jgi:hypothetical protein
MHSKIVLWNLEQHFTREAKRIEKKAARLMESLIAPDNSMAGQVHAYRIVAEKLMLARLGNRIRPKPKHRETIAVSLLLEEHS